MIALTVSLFLTFAQVFLAVVEAARGLLENDVQAPMKVHEYIHDGGYMHTYTMILHTYTIKGHAHITR